MGKVGVPGGILYEYTCHTIFDVFASSLPIVFSSGIFWCYTLFFWTLCAVFAFSEYDDELRALAFSPGVESSLRTLCIFTLTFFLSNVFSKINARFENVCKTNGNVTRLSALAAGSLLPVEAETLMRYTNAIMHIYYLLLSGPLDDGKWALLERRGLLTAGEIAQLQQQGSPAVVIYSWCVALIRAMRSPAAEDAFGSLLFVQAAMEQQVGSTRGLAAKQIAYTRFQIPFVYYHTVELCVNVYLLLYSLSDAHQFGRATHTNCHRLAAHPAPTHDDDEVPLGGTCVPAAVMCVLGHVVLMMVYLAVLLTRCASACA